MGSKAVAPPQSEERVLDLVDNTDSRRESRSARGPSIPSPVDRPGALVIGSQAGRRLIEHILAEDFDVVTATHHLIELHGGGIEAASPGEGRGTTFTVRLPVLESPQPVPAEHAR